MNRNRAIVMAAVGAVMIVASLVIAVVDRSGLPIGFAGAGLVFLAVGMRHLRT